MRRSSSASRSFVLAALRALHLDPDCGPPPQTRCRNEAKQQANNQRIPPSQGSSTQIRTTVKRLAAPLVSVLGFACTANGYRPLSKNGYGSGFAFGYGVFASELPMQTLGV